MSSSAEYMKGYRDRSPEYVDRQRRLAAVRTRAYRELAHNHPNELRVIMNRICTEEGIPPPYES